MTKTQRGWVILLSLSWFSMTLCNGADYNRNKGTIERIGNDGASYTLGVTASELGVPTGLIFDTKPGSTTYVPGTMVNRILGSSLAQGTVVYPSEALPASDISVSIDGLLVGDGSGGRQLTWEVTGTIKAPLYVRPLNEFGISHPFTAYRGSSPITAGWNTLTPGVNLSATMGSTVTVAPSEPGVYHFEAVEGNEQAEAEFIRLGAKFKSLDNEEITTLKIIKGDIGQADVILLPEDQSIPASFTLSSTGTSITPTGSAPGRISVYTTSNSSSSGSVILSYSGEPVATLGINVVDYLATLQLWHPPGSTSTEDGLIILKDNGHWTGFIKADVRDPEGIEQYMTFNSFSQTGANSKQQTGDYPFFSPTIDSFGDNTVSYIGNMSIDRPIVSDSISFNVDSWVKSISSLMLVEANDELTKVKIDTIIDEDGGQYTYYEDMQITVTDNVTACSVNNPVFNTTTKICTFGGLVPTLGVLGALATIVDLIKDRIVEKSTISSTPTSGGLAFTSVKGFVHEVHAIAECDTYTREMTYRPHTNEDGIADSSNILEIKPALYLNIRSKLEESKEPYNPS